MKLKLTLFYFIVILFSLNVSGQIEQTKGKNPIIIIPGIMGSTLVNPETKENVWVRFNDKTIDDIDLPTMPNLSANKDSLVAGEIIEEVKILKFLPGLSVYGDLIKFMDKKAGYRRVNWETADKDDFQDVYLTFPYDWRKDNVETAKILIQKIEKLKTKLGKPNLKFDILAHSMGGLIARYAAMYGSQDLQIKPNPTWAGAKHFNKIMLLGTPNEGSMQALDTLYNGYSIQTPAGRYYPPFLNRKVGFSIPSIFQLLPHGNTAHFYDENLDIMNIDIYQIDNWEKHGWSYLEDEKLTKGMSKTKRQQAEKYLEATLLRTKRFHEALDAKTKIPTSLQFYVLGSDCKNTLDAAVIYQDKEKDIWKTLTRSDSFRNIKGEKISAKNVEEKIFAIGDGTVSLRSLLAETVSQENGQSLFFVDTNFANKKIVCESHVAIPNNKTLQEEFISILSGKSKPISNKISFN